jgi:hypothetical protein
MGMARQAPEPRYIRKHNISHHALERFRERVEEDVKCRSNSDISNLLDETICQATGVYTVRDPRAPEAITKLVEIDLRSGTYYAVVRDGTVITVLDASMVKDNYDLSYAPTLNAPFADKLRDLQLNLAPRKLTPKEQAIASGALPPPALVPPVPPAPSPLEVAGVEYARAEKRYAECERALQNAKDELARASAALADAGEQRTDAMKKLMTLATGQTP